MPSIRKLGGGVRIALAQFRELEAFAQFASDLDDASREQLEQGQKVTEVMKQKQYSPMSVGEMSVMLFAVNEGYMKDVELNKVADFESALSILASEYKELMANLDETGEYSDDVLAIFKEALEKFKSTQTWLKWQIQKKSENQFPVFQIRKKLRAPWKWSLLARCAKPKIEWKWADLMQIACSPLLVTWLIQILNINLCI